MFITIVVIIGLISIILSVWSLKKQNIKKETHHVKKKLQQGRVVFQKDTHKN